MCEPWYEAATSAVAVCSGATSAGDEYARPLVVETPAEIAAKAGSLSWQTREHFIAYERACAEAVGMNGDDLRDSVCDVKELEPLLVEIQRIERILKAWEFQGEFRADLRDMWSSQLRDYPLLQARLLGLEVDLIYDEPRVAQAVRKKLAILHRDSLPQKYSKLGGFPYLEARRTAAYNLIGRWRRVEVMVTEPSPSSGGAEVHQAPRSGPCGAGSSYYDNPDMSPPGPTSPWALERLREYEAVGVKLFTWEASAEGSGWRCEVCDTKSKPRPWCTVAHTETKKHLRKLNDPSWWPPLSE